MKNWVNNIINLKIDDITKYKFPTDEYFGLEVLDNNVKYEFIIRLSSSNKGLLCLGSGVIDQKTKSIPRFQRYRWKDHFEESLIYYFDPTLYLTDELQVGWCIGTKDDWYLEKISEIIKKIIHTSKIKEEHVLFYGTSAGGFVSAMLATMIKGSTAFVGNFQYSILKVHAKTHLENMKKYCFEGLNNETIKSEYGYRIDLIEMFKKEKYVPPIIYYVNANSKVDILGQCVPFIKDLEKLDYSDNDIEIIIYHDENGHRSRVIYGEAYEFIQMILKRKIYRYYNRSPVPNKKIIKINRENHALKAELKKMKNEIDKLNEENKNLKNNNIKSKMSNYLKACFKK
ncbi:MAG: hypothetical protein ISP01_01675 [Methanobrevibacter arboriphilus]|uniref:Uncharacterized protein n=1 Tax=Methanobrevibacter arboriphilus TaxID=39441 RepID=A0A843AB26_METAZ|nr:hypothetical protein [Methanobrevibacter arboriphilus]MBF4468092.1 hypothetical protein [Methanobrevibacter arboriphilus]